MTFNEVTHQIYNLALNMPCYINDIKFTSEKQVGDFFRPMLRKEKDQFIYEQCLPDGRWFCKITKSGNFYDYYVPDTRAQENRLISELFQKRA